MFKVAFPLYSLLALSYVMIGEVQASCFVRRGCVDDDANEERSAGDSWRTNNCYNCFCWEDEHLLKSCLEEDKNVPQDILNFSNESDQKQDTSETAASQGKIAQEVITVSHSNSSAIFCPPLPLPYNDPKTNALIVSKIKVVRYVTRIKASSCCTSYWTPNAIDSRCYKVWRQSQCRFDILTRENDEPCPYLFFGAVGK